MNLLDKIAIGLNNMIAGKKRANGRLYLKHRVSGIITDTYTGNQYPGIAKVSVFSVLLKPSKPNSSNAPALDRNWYYLKGRLINPKTTDLNQYVLEDSSLIIGECRGKFEILPIIQRPAENLKVTDYLGLEIEGYWYLEYSELPDVVFETLEDYQ